MWKVLLKLTEWKTSHNFAAPFSSAERFNVLQFIVLFLRPWLQQQAAVISENAQIKGLTYWLPDSWQTKLAIRW